MTQREQQILQWIREDPMISQEALAERAGITRSSVGVHSSNLMKKGHILGKGYLLPASRYVAVAGAVNVDIGGQSRDPLVPKDSNPGRVTVSLGGVGRNIAHNLTLLGVKVHLLTALGEDVHARQIEHSCQTLDIDLSRVLRVPEGATSTYLFLSDQGGDMVLAVSDMDIYEKLTPDYFARHLAFLNGAALLRYAGEALSMSPWQPDAAPDGASPLLTLATCSADAGDDDPRLLLHGRLVLLNAVATGAPLP